MSPLNTLEKAKKWANQRARTFSVNGFKASYAVLKFNEGYIVHDVKHILLFKKDYLSEEILYCSDEDTYKKLIIILRFSKNE